MQKLNSLHPLHLFNSKIRLTGVILSDRLGLYDTNNHRHIDEIKKAEGAIISLKYSIFFMVSILCNLFLNILIQVFLYFHFSFKSEL